ncbi:amino acid adenylation domain-containing protein [Sedimenticola sp.]|uniref:non-ribosomal peptide synthetase n=1 Tax=Sedimenticola sp. TaxID=1940285 RepID=UPI003D0F5824
MNSQTLINQLKSQGIHLYLQEDSLCYKARPGAMTASVRQLIVEHAAALKNDLQSLAAAAPKRPARILPVPRGGELPLSFSQQRMLFLYQLNPCSYNVSGAFLVTGSLNMDAWQRSLDYILSRHEILRTNFISDADGNRQIIHPQITLTVQHQGRITDKTAQEKQLKANANSAFQLSDGPLMRVFVIETADNQYYLQFVIHHIIGDAWSARVFAGELLHCYQKFCGRLPPALPALPIQYADFAAWQQSSYQNAHNPSLAFWTKTLKEIPALLLPTDNPRQLKHNYQGETYVFTVEAQLTADLKGVARRQCASLFMVLITGFQVLLSRYTQQTDFGIGIPVANRSHAEIEPLIGYFANSLVLRADLSKQPGFATALQRTKLRLLQAFEHQDFPFEKLVETLKPQRDLGLAPFFQVMFGFQNLVEEKIPTDNGLFQAVHIEDGSSLYDLIMDIHELQSGLSVRIKYDTDLFNRDTVERMGQHYLNILSQLCENLEQSISHCEFLTAVERERTLDIWCNANDEYTAPVNCISQRFVNCARRTPDSIALAMGDIKVTYDCLDQLSNRIAAHLRQSGIGAEQRVGIHLPRSVEMIAAMIAVFKSGAAYVPLDPDYPRQQLRYIVADSALEIILSHSGLCAMPTDLGVDTLDLNNPRIMHTGNDSGDGVPVPAVRSDQLAYIIYTSGSTGNPKGVAIERRSLINFVDQACQLFELTARDCVLQQASINFDASVLEIWIALASGARLQLFTTEGPFSLQALGQTLETQKVSCAFITPSVLASLPPGEYRHLTKIITGGEACPVELINHWRRGRTIFNAYGPTEGTVFASCYRFDQQRHYDKCLMGPAIANTAVLLLDANDQVVPTGVSGEICIAGAGLARGYVNQPRLTAEKFTGITLPGLGSQKFYRSGDCARWLADGSMEFLGRTDAQVKIKGIRIELGEVEQAIRRFDGVTDVYMRVCEQGQLQKQLVAYIVFCPDSPKVGTDPAINSTDPATEALKQYLSGQLPRFMVPDQLIAVARLPLNASNKIDVDSLPKPRRSSSQPYRPPGTDSERQLTGLLQELLGIVRLGVDDNLFDLGVHSLLASQFIVRINTRLNTEMTVRDFYENPTISRLAALVEQNTTSVSRPITRVQRGEPSKAKPTGGLVLAPLSIIGRRRGDIREQHPDISKQRPPLFCIHPAGGQVHCYVPLAELLGSARPVIGIQSRALQTAAGEYPSISAMASAYADAIEGYCNGPCHLLGWSLGGVIAAGVARALEARGRLIASLTLLDSQVRTEQSRQKILGPLLPLSLVFGAHFSENFSRLDPQQQQSIVQSLLSVPAEQRLRRSFEIAQQRGGLPREIEYDSLEQQLKLTETHVRLLAAHVPEPVNCDIHSIWARETLREAPGRATASLTKSTDTEAQLATQWQGFTRGRLYSTTMDGNHFSLLSAPGAQHLANTIGAFLNEQGDSV